MTLHPGRLARFVALVLALLTCGTASAGIRVLATSFADGPLQPDATLTLTLDRLPEASEGDLHLVVGNVDVTPLLRVTPDAGLILDAGIPVLSGDTGEVALYLVTPGRDWQLIDRWPVQVAGGDLFESSEFKPRLELTNKGQLAEGHSRDAGKPQRRKYQDAAMQAGFDSSHSRGDLQMSSSVNLFGSSVRQEALRFGEKGSDAPKVDLGDYLLQIDKGSVRLAVGHISYGNNPLLINGVGNRGLLAQYRFGDRLDVSVTSMNGTRIVGYSNLLGQRTRDHNISAATVGVELLGSRPGGLRVEFSYMDASIQSTFDFDVGEVPDAETNRGFGIRVTGSSPGGRLRGDLSLARSRYRNPQDPVLAQGDTLVKVRPRTDGARHLELSYEILRALPLGEQHSASLTLSFTHDRADPLYRSVGAFTQADRKANQLALTGQLGPLSVQARHQRMEDNIDDIATLLKTRTRQTTASLALPLGALLDADATPSPWWPQLSYSYERVHQFAANDPDQATSGFNGASHLPDQVNSSHGLGVQWSAGGWSLGYRWSLNDQDNRQPGRERADFRILTHDLNLGVQPLDSVSLSAVLSLGRNADREQDLDRETRTWGVNADWRLPWGLSFSATTPSPGRTTARTWRAATASRPTHRSTGTSRCRRAAASYPCRRSSVIPCRTTIPATTCSDSRPTCEPGR